MSQTLGEVIRKAADAPCDTRAIEFQGRWITWGEMAQLMRESESLLSGAGLGAGTPVAVLLRNRPALVAAALQLLASGRCLVMVNPFQAADKVASDLRGLRCPAVLADPLDWDEAAILDAAREVGALGLTVALDSGVSAVPSLAEPGLGPFHETLDGIAVLMLSSGTTGPAKRIRLPYAKLEQSFVRAAAYESKRPSAGAVTKPVEAERSPSVLSAPLVHIGGLYFSLDAVLAGRPLVLMEKFSVAEYVRVLGNYRPKMITLPPAALRMIFDAGVEPGLFSSVKAIRSGSAPLAPEFRQQFEARYRVPVLDVYGATEFAGAVAGWSLADHQQYANIKTGSVGRAQPGIELRVVDGESRTVLPAGQVGVLEIHTSDSSAGHWVHTTDLAELDADGFLYIRGRADDAIIRGGFKVLPREIEAVLREHPDVHEACVVGLPEPRLGAIPVAAVELRDGSPPIAPESLLAWLRTRVVAYQVPVSLRIVPALPRTPSMKISQHEVKALFPAANA